MSSSTRSNQKISPVPLWTAGPCVGQKLHNLPLTPCFGFRLSVPTIIQCRASWLILWLLNTRGPWSCTAPLRVTFPCRLVLLGRFFFLSDTRTASIKSLFSFRESAFHRAMRIKFLCYTFALCHMGKSCKQPRSKLICILAEISYIWRGNLDLNKGILKQNRKCCKKCL